MRRGNSKTVVDLTHFHNNGILKKVLGIPTLRYWDEGVYLNGSQNYIAIPHAANLIPATITLIAMVNPMNLAGGARKAIISKITAPAWEGYNWTFFEQNKIEFWTGAATSTYTHSSNFDSTKNYHIAVTYDGANVAHYINGVLGLSEAKASDFSSTDEVWIGHDHSAAGRQLKGMIDCVRIHNTALSANEIKKEYYRAKLENTFNLML